VSLSQAAQDNNEMYTAFMQPDTDEWQGASDDDGNINELDSSMAMYGSKSPERLSRRQQDIDETRSRLQNASAYSLLHPKFESLCAAVGKDPA